MSLPKWFSEQGERVLKEGNGLLSDGKNIAYDDENIVETVVPAKTTPIIVADAGDLNKEEFGLDGEDVDFFGVPFDQEADAPVKKKSKNNRKQQLNLLCPNLHPPSKAAPVIPKRNLFGRNFTLIMAVLLWQPVLMPKIRQIVREAKRTTLLSG